MEKKYQVFVSSTFEDLITERQEIMRIVLELNCIPTGMELFPSSQTKTFEFIEKIIDDCDYFILVIGETYGSIHSSGKSYTQMEYEYALSKEIPIITFVKKCPDITDNKLLSFIELVQLNIVRKWGSKNDLGLLVGRSLMKLISDYPRNGWIKNNNDSGESSSLPSTLIAENNSKFDLILKALYPNPKIVKIENDQDIIVELEILDLMPSKTIAGSFLLILTDQNKNRLPIVIGMFEAQAIAIEMEKITPSRPLTHDLLINTIIATGYTIERVEINELIDGVFNSKIVLIENLNYIELTARPSDAIALAIRLKRPIFCSQKIMNEMGVQQNLLSEI